MSKEKVPTYEEWVKERQDFTNECRARASAYHDSARPVMKGFWTWLRDAFLELNHAFHALEWVDSYRREGDYKINQIVVENQKKLDFLIKSILGLDGSATEKDVEKRAKEFGSLVDSLIDKKRNLDKVLKREK